MALLSRRVNCLVFVDSDKPKLISVRPCRKWFKTAAGLSESGFVNLGNRYVAFYVFSSDPGYAFNRVSLGSSVYVFRRGLFGYRNIDLSDRLLYVSLQNITKVKA